MPRVLVVDDSRTIRKAVELCLRGTDWIPDFAVAGGEGTAKALHDRPDLILLDFVLPDMKGTDVCAELSTHARTASIPIIIMTAKDDSVRALFTAFTAVKMFVAKPFTPDALLECLNAVSQEREPNREITQTRGQTLGSGRPPSMSGGTGSSSSPAPGGFTFQQKEAAARTIYARLRQPLGLIPEWMKQLGNTAPASFFARKILTPDFMSELLEALLPIYRERLVDSLPLKPPAADDASRDGSSFHASVKGWPTHEILRTLMRAQRTGECTLATRSTAWMIYVRDGHVIFATSKDTVAYLRDSTVNFSHVPQSDVAFARREQEQTGKPLYVTLAERGHLPAPELLELLMAHTRGSVVAALTDSGDASISFRDLLVLPSYVEAYAHPLSMRQITLDWLRNKTPTTSEIEKLIPSNETVFARVHGFSRVVVGLSLASDERRILGLVDGRANVGGIRARSGASEADLHRVLYRLSEAGLIHSTSSTPLDVHDPTRPVLIFEPDVTGFQVPLGKLLNNRAEPVPLISFDSHDDLVQVIRKERPRLVILNADAMGAEATKAVRRIRAQTEWLGLPVAAVVDAPLLSKLDSLSAAGFDAVLVKPISYADVERLLVA